MKLDRMLYIITYLLNHKKVKAQELAEKFEVSVRTIYRDVDAISQAGIPIVTYQGMDGGIGIMEGFKLDRNLLTGEEISKIVNALKGIQSISEDVKIKLLIEKLTGITANTELIPTGNEIMIDLSSWNRYDQLGKDIEKIKDVIRRRRLISFRYYTNEKLTERKAEPYQIIFKESNWYLYAFCLLRNDFRLFKLRRMSGLKILDEGFEPRPFTVEEMQWDEAYDRDNHLEIVILFDPVMKYSIDDIFGVENYEFEEDGRLRVTFIMPPGTWLYGFLLGFGDKAEVLEPPELREKICSMAESISGVYRHHPEF
jgi:predicted DNA-binding transcriptional regulator YafY